ncbi:hypothetical protein [Streptomyces sp. NPDC048565]|uniref:hypothetical protein n=1 Tax=Streptomyces sp. NPDC048565 TaxID=3155266 RepID=UPI00343DE583
MQPEPGQDGPEKGLWSPSLLTMRRLDPMAWEHLTESHDASRGRAAQESGSLRKGRRVALPLCAVLVIALLVLFLAG